MSTMEIAKEIINFFLEERIYIRSIRIRDINFFNFLNAKNKDLQMHISLRRREY